MSVLVYVNRKAKLYGRRKKVYPFQFVQSGIVSGKHRVYFKRRKQFKVSEQKKKLYPAFVAPPPPVGFIAYKKPRRPKISRARVKPYQLRRAKVRYIIPAQP